MNVKHKLRELKLFQTNCVASKEKSLLNDHYRMLQRKIKKVTVIAVLSESEATQIKVLLHSASDQQR